MSIDLNTELIEMNPTDLSLLSFHLNTRSPTSSSRVPYIFLTPPARARAKYGPPRPSD